jgi:hypothetical protein
MKKKEKERRKRTTTTTTRGPKSTKLKKLKSHRLDNYQKLKFCFFLRWVPEDALS